MEANGSGDRGDAVVLSLLSLSVTEAERVLEGAASGAVMEDG